MTTLSELIGISFPSAVIIVFLFFKFKMGWYDSLMRTLSSFLIALLVFFLGYTFLGALNDSLLNVLAFYTIWAVAAFFALKTHSENKQAQNETPPEIQKL